MNLAPCICRAPADGTGPGRPRAYDRDAALAAMTEVFRRRGYEGASLGELTAASGLSRSSFYCCFGSKRGALIAAVEAYSAEALARAEAASALPDGREGVLAVIRAMACASVAAGGCFAINAATELAAEDAEIAAALTAHFQGLEALLARRLNPDDPEAEAPRAAALAALGIGAQTLRKAGMGDAAADAALAAAKTLLDAPAPG